jgi:hypothetical protein
MKYFSVYIHQNQYNGVDFSKTDRFLQLPSAKKTWSLLKNLSKGLRKRF